MKKPVYFGIQKQMLQVFDKIMRKRMIADSKELIDQACRIAKLYYNTYGENLSIYIASHNIENK